MTFNQLWIRLACIIFINTIITYLLQPGETLRDFYKRTNLYWQMAAHEHTQHTGKASTHSSTYDLYANYYISRCQIEEIYFGSISIWIIYCSVQSD